MVINDYDDYYYHVDDNYALIPSATSGGCHMPEYAKDAATDLVNVIAVAGAAYAIIPIPGTTVGLAAVEGTLVLRIGKIYGVNLGGGGVGNYILKEILAFAMGNVALGASLKALSEVLTFAPGIGWLVKSGIAASTIKILGESVIMVFEDNFPGAIARSKPRYDQFERAFSRGARQAGYDENDLIEYYGNM